MFKNIHRISWILASCSLAGISATGHEVIQAHAGSKPQSGPSRWTCPMHAQVQSDSAGSCPICKMDLVKSATAGPAPVGARASIEVANETRQRSGVKLGQATLKSHAKAVLARGQLVLDTELREAVQNCAFAVSQLMGQSDPAVIEKYQSILQASKARMVAKGVPADQLEAVISGQVSPRAATIYREGEPLWITADFPGQDAGKLKVGMTARVRSPFFPSNGLVAEVRTVSENGSAQDPITSTRLLVRNPAGRIRFDSMVEVELNLPLGTYVTVPSDSVHDDGRRSWVFVQKGDGTFEPRKVELVFRDSEQAAIRKGLSPGETIVTSGNFLIDSESRLRAP